MIINVDLKFLITNHQQICQINQLSEFNIANFRKFTDLIKILEIRNEDSVCKYKLL